MSLMMCGDPGISLFPEAGKEPSLAARTRCTKGWSTSSPSFPNDYPFIPPRVKFDTPCFHPNVDVYGNICLDILQDKWSSAYDVRTILRSIQSLLGEPNNDSTLNSQAATLWINQGEFRKVVEKFNKPAAA